jgi:hypothetical protein
MADLSGGRRDHDGLSGLCLAEMDEAEVSGKARDTKDTETCGLGQRGGVDGHLQLFWQIINLKRYIHQVLLPCVSRIVAFIVKNIDTIIFFCMFHW